MSMCNVSHIVTSFKKQQFKKLDIGFMILHCRYILVLRPCFLSYHSTVIYHFSWLSYDEIYPRQIRKIFNWFTTIISNNEGVDNPVRLFIEKKRKNVRSRVHDQRSYILVRVKISINVS